MGMNTNHCSHFKFRSSILEKLINFVSMFWWKSWVFCKLATSDRLARTIWWQLVCYRTFGADGVGADLADVEHFCALLGGQRQNLIPPAWKFFYHEKSEKFGLDRFWKQGRGGAEIDVTNPDNGFNSLAAINFEIKFLDFKIIFLDLKW